MEIQHTAKRKTFYLLFEMIGRQANISSTRKGEQNANVELFRSSFKFRSNPLTEGIRDGKEFDGTDVAIVYKCTPDTLLNLCVTVVDAMPLPMVYAWTMEDICRWLRECGYGQYQNTFRENLITGRSLLLLDSAALVIMNIKDFDHIKDITRAIRHLYYFDSTKFTRSLSLPPECYENVFKLHRLRTGAKYDVRRSVLWRQMQMMRPSESNYSHWDILENRVKKKPKCKILLGRMQTADTV